MIAETDLSLGLDGLETLLKTQANELVSVLEQGDINQALHLISELQKVKHQAFYNEVGYLTRGLHEAIKSFSAEVPVHSQNAHPEVEIQAIADASERLSYVIEVTEKTSHETMDRVDKSLALVDKMDEQSERFKELLSLVGQLEAEFEGLRGVYDRTCQLKEESEQTVAQMRAELTEILVAQSYQDITGQLIRRVITLVTQVESSLVQLMEMAAKVERISGLSSETELPNDEPENTRKLDPIQAEGPQIGTKKGQDVACDQDDVDELLSSLGF